MKVDRRTIRIRAKLAGAADYFKLMEAQLQDAQSLETFRLAAKYDLEDEEARNEHSAMRQFLQEDFSEGHVLLFRHSFLMSLHSLIERCLESICSEIATERGMNIKATD